MEKELKEKNKDLFSWSAIDSPLHTKGDIIAKIADYDTELGSCLGKDKLSGLKRLHKWDSHQYPALISALRDYARQNSLVGDDLRLVGQAITGLNQATEGSGDRPIKH